MASAARTNRTRPSSAHRVRVDVAAAHDGDHVGAGEAVRASRIAAMPSGTESSTTRPAWSRSAVHQSPTRHPREDAMKLSCGDRWRPHVQREPLRAVSGTAARGAALNNERGPAPSRHTHPTRGHPDPAHRPRRLSRSARLPSDSNTSARRAANHPEPRRLPAERLEGRLNAEREHRRASMPTSPLRRHTSSCRRLRFDCRPRPPAPCTCSTGSSSRASAVPSSKLTSQPGVCESTGGASSIPDTPAERPCRLVLGLDMD